MFKRIALNYLREWAKKDERKPLVLRGARQVGKTTLVRMFAEEFSNYIYLNSSLKFEIMAKQLYVASQRVL